MLKVRANYRISIGMFAVFAAVTPHAIVGRDVIGIAVGFFGILFLGGIIVYQFRNVYFSVTDSGLSFGSGLVILGCEIAEHTVFETRGRGEGFFTCLNVNISLKSPLTDVMSAYLEERKWAKVSGDRKGVFITLAEPSTGAAELGDALARLRLSRAPSFEA